MATVPDVANPVSHVQAQIPEGEEEFVRKHLGLPRDAAAKQDDDVDIGMKREFLSSVSAHGHQGEGLLVSEQGAALLAFLQGPPEILVHDLGVGFLEVAR
jgi:hypothetical protein